MSEEVLWKGSPSQVLNLGKYVVGILLTVGLAIAGAFPGLQLLWIALVLPLGWMLWVFIETKSIRHELTTERIKLSAGVFNQKLDDVELYRVKDTSMERPFWYRVFGLSTLIIETSDRSQPRIEIKAVRNGDGLRETLRKQVEFWRDRKRVREVDFDEKSLVEGAPGQDDETLA
ncbi:PH domain-containing protein [Luteolibacter flavescens]|uniref:PH domain-containing protein n=1 Tax=Luteolibacter flavescens TaxID=1859460 RepID=A0ABT3FT89_9BACT|nr:PH domain-containing protein [Luteolibacter flavescens]MCW1886779.1 PH domain-containing protein [Luteolibacter flavescens]